MSSTYNNQLQFEQIEFDVPKSHSTLQTLFKYNVQIMSMSNKFKLIVY